MTQTYIVRGTLQHDGRSYPPGSQFASDNAELIADLRRLGALALPAETMSADEIAAREAQLQAQNAQLAAELEALKSQVADKSGSSDESGAEPASEPAAE